MGLGLLFKLRLGLQFSGECRLIEDEHPFLLVHKIFDYVSLGYVWMLVYKIKNDEPVTQCQVFMSACIYWPGRSLWYIPSSGSSLFWFPRIRGWPFLWFACIFQFSWHSV